MSATVKGSDIEPGMRIRWKGTPMRVVKARPHGTSVVLTLGHRDIEGLNELVAVGPNDELELAPLPATARHTIITARRIDISDRPALADPFADFPESIADLLRTGAISLRHARRLIAQREESTS